VEPKILLIAQHLEMAAPLQQALQERGFAVGLNTLQFIFGRKPRTAQYDLVVALAQSHPREEAGSPSPLRTIDAVFLSVAPSGATAIQSFQNGVYQLQAGDAGDLEKFVCTVETLLADKTRPPISSPSKNCLGSRASLATLLGNSPEIEAVRKTINSVSRFPSVPVLISGETGTGKELVADLLHACSPRPHKPIIKVNCSTLPETLIESELFGHRKGAFTGALTAHQGLVEAAQGGMLLLDEIGTLKLELQPKLLRLLENGSYLPVGETYERQSHAWIIAATNQDLREAVKKNLFRADLYYRLQGAEISLPPLRERGEDVILLAEYFLTAFAREYQLSLSSLPENLKAALRKYDWPGNVRELKHAMRSILMTTLDPQEMASHFISKFLHESTPHGQRGSAATTLREAEKAHILKTLVQTHSNLKQSARLLGIDRNTLLRKMLQYGIPRGAFRTPQCGAFRTPGE